MIQTLHQFLRGNNRDLKKLFSKQVIFLMNPLLLKFQCGFRKGFSAQDYLGALLTDLSKAFNCLSNELIAAELNA